MIAVRAPAGRHVINSESCCRHAFCRAPGLRNNGGSG